MGAVRIIFGATVSIHFHRKLIDVSFEIKPLFNFISKFSARTDGR